MVKSGQYKNEYVESRGIKPRLFYVKKILKIFLMQGDMRCHLLFYVIFITRRENEPKMQDRHQKTAVLG